MQKNSIAKTILKKNKLVDLNYLSQNLLQIYTNQGSVPLHKHRQRE